MSEADVRSQRSSTSGAGNTLFERKKIGVLKVSRHKHANEAGAQSMPALPLKWAEPELVLCCGTGSGWEGVWK